MLQRAILMCVAALLLGTAAGWAQHDSEKPQEAGQEEVAPDDFVVLITGACQTKPEEFSVRDCIRGITRKEFEEILSLQPVSSLTPKAREELARRLAEIIIYSNEAKKRNLTKDPAVRQVMRFAQLQALAGLVAQDSVKTEAGQIRPSLIEQYYQAHLRDYQSADFQRITVPNTGDNTADQQFAESIRVRCASGGDLGELQADADARVNQSKAAPVDLANQRPAESSASQQAIFDLKPGNCAVVAGDRQKQFVYKMIASSTKPLSEVQNAIARTLSAELARQSLANIASQSVISLNQKYFQPAKKVPAK